MFQRNFLMVICFLIAIGATAQSRFTFGVKGGVNLSESTDLSSSDNKVGFNAGLTVDYQLAPSWYVISGIELTTKGTKTSSSYGGYSYGYGSAYGSAYGNYVGTYYYGSELTENLMYLQIPIHLGYKVDVGRSTRLVFSAGPYVAYGIGGKTKGDAYALEFEPGFYPALGYSSGSYYNVDYNSFDGGNRRFDLGLGGSMGVEFGKFTVNIGYDWGLNNVTKNADSKNRNGYLSVGYKF